MQNGALDEKMRQTKLQNERNKPSTSITEGRS